MRDEDFYGRFVQPSEERMMSCIWRIVRDRESARDAMQNALATIWRKRRLVAGHANPEALILRICREAAIDQVRHSARRAVHETPLPELPEPAPGPSDNPHLQLCAAETAQQVRAAVAALPGNQALAVLMHLVEELPYAEVAAALECSEATVRVHVRRGREKLRQTLCRQLEGISS